MLLAKAAPWTGTEVTEAMHCLELYLDDGVAQRRPELGRQDDAARAATAGDVRDNRDAIHGTASGGSLCGFPLLQQPRRIAPLRQCDG